MIIGLTGLYCAGKNHIALMLEQRGIPVLDVDKLGHEVIISETENIVRRFGNKILDCNGKIDRKLLGKLVFGRPKELAGLEAIVHPRVNCLAEEWAACNREFPVSVINAALLHKSSVYSKLDAIIAVKAPFPVRFFRAVKRDKRPIGELLKRAASQKDFPRYKNKQNLSKLFFSGADIYTIQNSGISGSRKELEKRIETILEGLCNGKEKTTACCGFCGSVSGNRLQRGDFNH